MSFQAPVPPGAVYGHSSANPSHDDLSSGISNINLSSPSKSRKKRPARAFHTDLQPPSTFPSTPTQSFSPTPTHGSFGSPQPYLQQNPYPQQQQYAQNPYPASIAHTAQNQAFPPHQAQSPASHSTPQDMGQPQNESLSLPEYRFSSQQDFLDPQASFLTFHNVAPPDASVQFHATDQGTASSKFIRSSMYYVPESEQLRQATKLPVSVTVRPFAPLLDTEEPVPVVDMRRLEYATSDTADNGPIRCRRCRTYINPSMQFTHYGKFVCNICQFPNNTVPTDYTAMLDNNGQRIDKFVRPELHRGVYDLIVPEEYHFNGSKEAPGPLHHLFLVDISEHSRKQNLPMVLADAIRATLYNDNASGVTKVSLVTFDKRIHFYNLSARLESTQIVISSDLDDPFVPFDDGLFVDPEESRHVIEDALNHLESLSQGDTIADAEPCFSAALRTAMMCLEGVGGGKITAVLASLPSWGPGGLKYKDNKAVGRTPAPEVEQKVFLPDSEYYKLLGKDFIDKSVGLDLFVASPTAVDLSNIGWLCSLSGGSVSRWTNFDFERDSRAFTAAFVASVANTRGYQGQLKLRCSNGLQVSQYYGTSSSVAETTSGGSIQDPVVPILGQDQTFTVLMEYDGKLSTKYDCHFQSALLYTDPQGIRKVRVINLVLAVSERLEDVFNFADENAIVTTIVRDTLSFIGKQPLTELCQSVNQKLVDIFTQYRAMSELGHNQNRTMTNQLLFPDSLKHLPMYLMAFTKIRAIRLATGIAADARLAQVYRMLNCPVESLVFHLYPALVELHSLDETDGYYDQGNGFIKLPRFKPASVKSLEHGVYIMCDGFRVYVWVDPESNILLIKDLFGQQIESVSEISPLIDELPELPTPISEQARNIISYFQSKVVGIPSVESAGIRLVRPGLDGSVVEFKEALIEDSFAGSISANTGPSYVDYLSNLHKAIRVQLDNDKSSNKVRKSVINAEQSQSTLTKGLLNF